MANKDYTAAEAVKLFIGDFELDAIRIIETGEYRLAQNHVLLPVNLPSNWILRLQSDRPKALDSLRALGFRGYSVDVKITNAAKARRAKTLSIDDAWAIWRFEDRRNNAKAQQIIDALGIDSLRDRFDQAYGKARASQEERRKRDNRVMKKPCPWDLMYQPDLCRKVQKWYGFDCNKFYWWYAYNFLSSKERADIDEYNPLIKHTSKSGSTRTMRRARIHQHLSPETRERLHDFAEYLALCIKFSSSRIEFEKKWSLEYGLPTQLEIFDLWEFAS